MKTITNLFVLTAIGLTTSAHSQTLGTASNYNLLVQEGGFLELKDANQLSGQVGVSNNAELDAGGESTPFNGTLFKHTGGTIKDGENLAPTGGIQSSGAIDAALNQANADIASYTAYLDGLYNIPGATATFGKQDSTFSYDSIMDLTLLDFTEIDLEDDTFTLNGRAGFNDKFIIRVDEFLEFKDSDLLLNNVDIANVTWYFTSDGKFDLHKSDSADDDPNLFMKFAGNIVAPDAEIRLGEVNFTGSVYGSQIKLGSGAVFVPEPSSSLMLLIGAAGLILRRRRSA